MNILWITNIMMPPICEAMNYPVPAVGGWMYSSLKRVTNISQYKFAVATIYSGEEFIYREIDNVCYYLLPLCGKSRTIYNRHLEIFWTKVKEDFQPDVIHIHGTEFPHGLAYIRACGSDGVVVSLQGIISSIAHYYTAGIRDRELNESITFRDIVKRDSIKQQQKRFERRGEYEIELLKRVGHIIGRTDWDKSHSWEINPDAQYHYCGETLRDSFYGRQWFYATCEPHSIFVSQASYPIKGLHMLLKALPLIIRKYPDTKVYVAGSDPTSSPAWRISGYGKYLKKLIERYDLKSHIVFTGSLNEEAMSRQYLRSNVFVCCSAIENSPNSLGEAQLLGVPYVVSFVGGVPEIVNWNPDILYRFEEYEMMAEKIIRVFDAGEDIETLEFDSSRYDGLINSRLMLDIYKKTQKLIVRSL